MINIIALLESNEIKIARFSSLGINLLNSLLFIKLYGLKLFGVFAFFISILKIISVIGSFGSALTSTRAFGITFATEKSKLRQQQSVFAQIIIIFSIIIAVISSLSLYFFSVIAVNDLLWFFLTAIIVSWIEFSVNIFRSNKSYVLYYLTGSSLHVSIAISILFISMGISRDISDSQIILALFVSSVLVVIINFYYLFIRMNFSICVIKINQIKEVLATNFSAFITSVFSSITGSFEVILARLLFGDVEAAVARMSFQLFYLVTTPIGLVNMEYHNLVNSANSERYKRIYRLMKIKSLKMILYGLIPFITYLIILTNDLSFEYQVILLVVMLIAYFIEVSIGPSNLFIHLANKTSVIFHATLLSLAIRFCIIYIAYYFEMFEILAIILSVAISNIMVKIVTRKKIKL